MIAADSPLWSAMARKNELMIARLGRPNDILDTPRIVCPCSSSRTLRNVSNVTIADALSEEIVIASPSITMSSRGTP